MTFTIDQYFIQLSCSKIRCPQCNILFSTSRHRCHRRQPRPNTWIDCSREGKLKLNTWQTEGRNKSIQLLLQQPSFNLNLYKAISQDMYHQGVFDHLEVIILNSIGYIPLHNQNVTIPEIFVQVIPINIELLKKNSGRLTPEHFWDLTTI